MRRGGGAPPRWRVGATACLLPLGAAPAVWGACARDGERAVGGWCLHCSGVNVICLGVLDHDGLTLGGWRDASVARAASCACCNRSRAAAVARYRNDVMARRACSASVPGLSWIRPRHMMSGCGYPACDVPAQFCQTAIGHSSVVHCVAAPCDKDGKRLCRVRTDCTIRGATEARRQAGMFIGCAGTGYHLGAGGGFNAEALPGPPTDAILDPAALAPPAGG